MGLNKEDYPYLGKIYRDNRRMLKYQVDSVEYILTHVGSKQVNYIIRVLENDKIFKISIGWGMEKWIDGWKLEQEGLIVNEYEKIRKIR